MLTLVQRLQKRKEKKNKEGITYCSEEKKNTPRLLKKKKKKEWSKVLAW